MDCLWFINSMEPVERRDHSIISNKDQQYLVYLLINQIIIIRDNKIVIFNFQNGKQRMKIQKNINNSVLQFVKNQINLNIQIDQKIFKVLSEITNNNISIAKIKDNEKIDINFYI
ncbi:hypothetical protein pb186bvf_014282 [Paramecium bursaria]